MFTGITASIAANIFLKADKAVEEIITPQSVKDTKKKAADLASKKSHEEFMAKLEKKKKENQEYTRKKRIEWENRNPDYDDLAF